MSLLLKNCMDDQENNQIHENLWCNKNQYDWPDIRALQNCHGREDQDRNHWKKWEQCQDSPAASHAPDGQEL
jgi:hypothetical protein